MKTTDNFASCKRDAMLKILRKFTVKDGGADGIVTTSATSTIATEFLYNDNPWYSVHVDEIRDEENCYGVLSFTLYLNHPEWGTYIIAEEDCRFASWAERMEIMVNEFIQCIGIIELD